MALSVKKLSADDKKACKINHDVKSWYAALPRLSLVSSLLMQLQEGLDLYQT